LLAVLWNMLSSANLWDAGNFEYNFHHFIRKRP